MNYKEIIENVLKNGTKKQATRLDSNGKVIPVENGTIGTFCEIFRHNMADGFPLTTLRKMPWQSIRVELEGFIKGITDKKWYQDRKCKFWDEWGNPVLVNEKHEALFEEFKDKAEYEGDSDILNIDYKEYKKKLQLEENDLGPIYGYQWRSFGQTYDYGQSFNDLCSDNFGLSTGTDQLKSIVEKLKTNPYDRRMVCSAWNPNQMHLMALPPCHWGFNVVVYGNKLNLIWHQRSCDLLLGVGANIASYALLLELLAFESGLIPGELVGTLADCHIYENHLDAAYELVKRDEKELPKLYMNFSEDYGFDIFDWQWKDAILKNYNPHDKVEVGNVTV